MTPKKIFKNLWVVKYLLFLLSVVSSIFFLNTSASAFSAAGAKVLHETYSGYCPQVMTAYPLDKFTKAYTAITSSDTPKSMGLTMSVWKASGSFESQLLNGGGLDAMRNDCAGDLEKSIQFGMAKSSGGSTSDVEKIRKYADTLRNQISNNVNSWTAEICKSATDKTACAQVESNIIQANVQTCAEKAVAANKPQPTAGSYSDILGCSGAEDRVALAKKCTDGGGTWSDKGCATSTADGTQEKETCNISGIGWIVCPVAAFIGTVTDAVYALVENMLVFNVPDPFGNNPLFQIWGNVRNIANIVFVLAFFAVIFSQATSMGISAYGIRKMLPRIIMAAILVNLSYYLCIFLVDISNIIGAGLDGIIMSALPPSKTTSGEIGWSTVITSALAVGLGAGAVAVGAGPAILSAALTFAIAALLAILVALLILVARQAILIMLIVLSPLAFAAYILPNTEDIFNKWRKMFTTMLVFYPLVAILFSGSKVASSIMQQAAPPGMAGALVEVFSLAVMAFPLFGTPFLLKFSGGLLGRIAGAVNNPNKGPFDRLRKRADGYTDRLSNQSKANRLQNFNKNNKGKQPTFWQRGAGASAARSAQRQYLSSTAQHNLNTAQGQYLGKALIAPNSGLARQAAGGRSASQDDINQAIAQGLSQLDEIEAKNLKAAQTVLTNARMDGIGLKKLLDGEDAKGLNGNQVKASPTMQLAAASMMMQQGREMDTVVSKLASSSNKEVREFAVGQIQANFANAKDRQVGLTDEVFMKKVINGEVTTQESFNRELTISTGIKAKDLNPEKLASQDVTSAARIEQFVDMHPPTSQIKMGPLTEQEQAYRSRSDDAEKIRQIAAAADKVTILARANEDTAGMIKRIKPMYTPKGP